VNDQKVCINGGLAMGRYSLSGTFFWLVPQLFGIATIEKILHGRGDVFRNIFTPSCPRDYPAGWIAIGGDS
jgi:hypothetical protein